MLFCPYSLPHSREGELEIESFFQFEGHFKYQANNASLCELVSDTVHTSSLPSSSTRMVEWMNGRVSTAGNAKHQ